MFRTFLALLVLVTLVSMCSSFQQPGYSSMQRRRSTTSLDGIFDKFVKGMEGNYKGDDSNFNKQKAADEQKRLAKRERMEAARQEKGFTELKDVKKKTFARVKYQEEEEDDDAPPKKKNIFGL